MEQRADELLERAVGDARSAASGPRSAASPAASASPWRSPARCSASRRSCCSTSRPPRSASRRPPQVLGLVKRSRERGLGVVMISHNLEDVFEVADRIVVLRLGRRVATFDSARRRASRSSARSPAPRPDTDRTKGQAMSADQIADRATGRREPAASSALTSTRLAAASSAPCRCPRRSSIWVVFQLAERSLPLRDQPHEPDASDRGLGTSRSASCWSCCSARSTSPPVRSQDLPRPWPSSRISTGTAPGWCRCSSAS